MKKIFLVTIFVSSLCFAQNNQSSLLELRNNLDVTLESSYTTSFQTTLEKKKPGVALIYSFLLPGMGELYADGYDSGIYFTAADVAIWGTLFGMNIYSNWQKDNYKSFAVTNAQINPEGKKDQYYSDISGYLSIDSFNEEKCLIEILMKHTIQKLITGTGRTMMLGGNTERCGLLVNRPLIMFVSL